MKSMPATKANLLKAISDTLQKQIPDVTEEKNFNRWILPQINGPKEGGACKNQMVLRQNYEGNWLAEIIERETGEMIARTTTPRSLIGSGCAAFLIMKGYKE